MARDAAAKTAPIGKNGIPVAERGDWLPDERYGLVEVGGWTDAAIPWPYRKKTGRRSLILCGKLVDDVRSKSETYICNAYGIGVVTVWHWRQALGVGRITEGTRKLLQSNTGVPPDAAARGRDAARSPESIAKMAATKRGRPAHPKTADALYDAACREKPEGWGKRANAWMHEGKKMKRNSEGNQ